MLIQNLTNEMHYRSQKKKLIAIGKFNRWLVGDDLLDFPSSVIFKDLNANKSRRFKIDCNKRVELECVWLSIWE